MRFVKNFFYRFMSGFYMDMRDAYQSNLIYNPIKAVKCDMKAQRWESKIK